MLYLGLRKHFGSTTKTKFNASLMRINGRTNRPTYQSPSVSVKSTNKIMLRLPQEVRLLWFVSCHSRNPIILVTCLVFFTLFVVSFIRRLAWIIRSFSNVSVLICDSIKVGPIRYPFSKVSVKFFITAQNFQLKGQSPIVLNELYLFS